MNQHPPDSEQLDRYARPERPCPEVRISIAADRVHAAPDERRSEERVSAGSPERARFAFDEIDR
jgi:hypothetical protein